MAEVVKHKLYQNQESFIPQIELGTQEQVQNLDQVVVLISDLEHKNHSLKAVSGFLQNSHIVESLKKSGSHIGYTQDNQKSQKFLVFYAESGSEENSRKGYTLARKNQALIQDHFKQQNENVNIYIGNGFSQVFLNEYIYGLCIQNYEWQFKSVPENKQSHQISGIFHQIRKFTLLLDQEKVQFDLKNSQLQYLLTIAKNKLYSKQLNNTRANIASTEYVYNEAVKFQSQNKDKVELFTLKGEEIRKQGLELMYAVGQAGPNESYLVCLSYDGNKDNKDERIALVGKGVVFDTGGLSLKRAGMERMYGDKGGACVCFGVFRAIVELGLKINVVCSLPLVENSISSNSYRVSDIWKTLKGITVEIGNTDAEGRNILADAMTFTQQKYKVQTVIDVATLTGACPQGLGRTVQGMFTNTPEKALEMMKFSNVNHEEVWNLPITDYMREQMMSDQADLRNSGKAPYGGSGQAACFLEHFIEKDIEWFHFDIAPSNQMKAEGQPVRTLVDYIKNKHAK